MVAELGRKTGGNAIASERVLPSGAGPDPAALSTRPERIRGSLTPACLALAQLEPRSPRNGASPSLKVTRLTLTMG